VESDVRVLSLQVFVTGASGKTGALVVQQLLKLSSEFEVAVAVRSDKVNIHMPASTADACVVPSAIIH
jgi:uncharacterized protein YbjT (DUF2867 family)